MKLAVFSDSHGNLDYLESAASFALNKANAEILVHLGDNYTDAKILNQFGRRLIRVPGVFSPQYQDHSVTNRIMETFNAWSVLVSHTHEKHLNDLPADLDPAELVRNRAVNIILHGHTHEPRVEESRGVWYVNPGHMKRSDKKNHPASFALVDLGESNATVQIIEVLGHAALMRKDLNLK